VAGWVYGRNREMAALARKNHHRRLGFALFTCRHRSETVDEH
jgi:hypothetical protein